MSKQQEPFLKSKVFTSCKECVFAEWDDITQIGCKINELNTEDTNVLAVYDEEKEFYVLNGLICPYYRTKSWPHKDKPDAKEFARKELTMDYEVVVVIQSPDDNIQLTIDSFIEQEKKPSHIHFVGPAIIKPDFVKNCPIKWSVEGQLNFSTFSDRLVLRNIIRKVKSPILCYVNAGTTLPNNVFSNLENKIIDDKFQFGLIKISKNEFIIPTVCYQYYNFMADKEVFNVTDVKQNDGVYYLWDLK